jgi:hypothetical protein
MGLLYDALRIVQSKMEHLNGEEKRLLRDIKVVKDIEDKLGRKKNKKNN